MGDQYWTTMGSMLVKVGSGLAFSLMLFLSSFGISKVIQTTLLCWIDSQGAHIFNAVMNVMSYGFVAIITAGGFWLSIKMVYEYIKAEVKSDG